MRTLFVSIILPLCFANGARGEALWQSASWALVGTAAGSAGYDSNLTLSAEGPGSAFLSAQPGLLLKRHGSATKLELQAAAAVSYYEKEEDLQTDGLLSLVYAYPLVENALPRFQGAANWRRYTAGNATLGRRVEAQTTDANFGGRIVSTGKLGLNSQLAYNLQDFSEEDLNTNQRVALTVGAGYQPNPNLEIALNFLSALGQSEANRAGVDRLKSREWGVTLQGRGKLAAKIMGSLYLGAAAIRYRGAFRRSDVLPVAGGEAVWQATARSRLVVALDVGADFSPEGESLAVQRATVTFEQTIHGPWQWRARVIPSSTRYYQEVRTRHDRSWGGGLGLMYEPSDRFEASLSYDLTDQRSDYAFGEFERNLISANVNYRF